MKKRGKTFDCVKNSIWYNLSMNIKKCDICKKKIKGYPVRAGAGFLSDKDLCLKCGKPILDLFKKHNFKIEEI
jgi:hypothetical protein